jgi:hypothetical protein
VGLEFLAGDEFFFLVEMGIGKAKNCERVRNDGDVCLAMVTMMTHPSKT